MASKQNRIRFTSFGYVILGALIAWAGYGYWAHLSEYEHVFTLKGQMSRLVGFAGIVLIIYGVILLVRRKGDFDHFEESKQDAENAGQNGGKFASFRPRR